MGKLDKIRQMVDEIIRDGERQKKEGSLSAEGKGMLLMAKTIADELAR